MIAHEDGGAVNIDSFLGTLISIESYLATPLLLILCIYTHSCSWM